MTVFCDWITLSQQHDSASTPTVNGGRVVKLVRKDESTERKFALTDDHGEVFTDMVVEYTTASAIDFEGSFDTSIKVKALDGMVTLSGNVGRFERPDNLFGYSVKDCIKIANRILASLGLPPFTGRSGRAGWYAKADTTMVDAAVITRIDLTKNYATGSQDNADRLMHYIAGMHRRNKAGKTYGASGVTWGEGSKYWYAKMYNKYRDLQKSKTCSTEVLEYVLMHGIVRDEIGLKQRYLYQTGLRSIDRWLNGGDDMENVVYGQFENVLKQTEVATDDFESIPGRLGEIAIAWRNGVDMKTRLPTATFYRYRKQLKAYGIDISERCDVSKLPFRCQVIQLAPVDCPSWYQLPQAA